VEVGAKDKQEDALRIGLAAASTIAQMALVYPAGKRRDVVLQGVASRSAERAERFARKYGIPKVCKNFDELYSSEDIDAVYISVPSEFHFEHGMQALEAGKHVLMEKPLAVNQDEAVKMVMMAKQKGLILMEAMHWRHHPAAKRAREILSSGEIGKVEKIEARFLSFDKHSMGFGDHWDDAKIRTKMLDRWIYCIDVARYLGGDARNIQNAKGNHDAFYIEGSGQIQSSEPFLLDFIADSKAWKFVPEFRATVKTSNGSLHFENFNFPFLYHRLDVTVNDGQCRTEKCYGKGESTFECQLEAFVRSVETKTPDKVSDGSNAVETLLIVEEFRKAIY